MPLVVVVLLMVAMAVPQMAVPLALVVAVRLDSFELDLCPV
jgi:hypothetical protein